MNQNEVNFLAREKFQQRIKKGMIGPGSDTWGLPDDDEIISNDTPLQRYFSGILFPDKGVCNSQSELDDANIQSETSKEDYEIDEPHNDSEKDEDETSAQPNIETETDKISKTNFFPTNIGLSICVPKNVNSLEVSFSFGLYYQPKNKEIKIEINEAGHHSFFDEKIPYQLPFKNNIKYEDGFMFLERELKGYAGGKGQKRSEEYSAFDEFKKSANLKDSSAQYYIEYLEKLINQSRIWKRKDNKINISISIKSTPEPIPFELEKTFHKNTKIGYNVRLIEQEGRKFVKIQLVNLSEKHPANRFSNKNEKLNLTSIFQSKIKINSTELIPYQNNNPRKKEFEDDEVKELDFVYRSIKNYAIGHNCSAQWNDEHNEIATTFLPVQNVKDVTNTFGKDDNKLNKALDMHNLSVWGFNKKETIEHLNYFISKYDSWIKSQKKSNLKEGAENQIIGNRIISRQSKNLDRLKRNLSLLDSDDTFRAFQIANTAMYIQLIISSDIDFGKNEKDLSEASAAHLDSLEFFRKYDANKRISENKIRFIPAYRPFQLAFLLLSIEGVIDPNSDARKEIVDLIWFPTGGGKTEAYLAVTAFTIAFRRLCNETGYEGTTVIMRYTLRLLTAQQFERASRLITALEFLRKQKEFKNDLREKPISIGLWVGMGSTPNTLKDAKKQIAEIDNESEKKNRKGELTGNPEGENTFQISSCPWCGTKLITKKKTKSGNTVWVHGFIEKRNDIKIACNNSVCTYSKEIPVQVVDEILYENPPTLLFGTVDKFAMLSWQDKAHRFFNSLDSEKLPPDLIIQDELHLLSGPLGSITGIFESVIEMLSGHIKKLGIRQRVYAI